MERGELRKRGVRVRLQTQPFRVLMLLLENAGELVTRDDIKGDLWPEDTFVDFDHGLNSAVNKIRQALGDTAASPRFLDTVPRQGYRFIAPVERGLRGEAEKAARPKPQVPAPPPASSAAWPPDPTSAVRRDLQIVVIAGVCLLVAVVIGVAALWPSPTQEAPLTMTGPWAVRILAGQREAQVGRDGALWEADRFFRGGDTAARDAAVLGAEEPFLFQGERYGTFEYSIPVPPGSYLVRVHLAETWFGPGNPGGGGAGSRRFELAVNGKQTLTGYEPFDDAGGANRAVVKQIEGVRPDDRGQIVLTFVSDRNYAMVNAIEVQPDR